MFPSISRADDISIDTPVNVTGDTVYTATGNITVNANITVTNGNLTFNAGGNYTQALGTIVAATTTNKSINIYSGGNVQLASTSSGYYINVYATSSVDASISVISDLTANNALNLFANGDIAISGCLANRGRGDCDITSTTTSSVPLLTWADYDKNGIGVVTRDISRNAHIGSIEIHTSSDIYLGDVPEQNNYWDMPDRPRYSAYFYATDGHNITVGPNGYKLNTTYCVSCQLQLVADNNITVNGDVWSAYRNFLYADYDGNGQGDFIQNGGKIWTTSRSTYIRGTSVQLGHIEDLNQSIFINASISGPGNVTCNNCNLASPNIIILNKSGSIYYNFLQTPLATTSLAGGSIGSTSSPIIITSGKFNFTASDGVHVSRANGNIDLVSKAGTKVTDSAGDFVDYGTDLSILTTGDITNSGDVSLSGGEIKLYASTIGSMSHPIKSTGSSYDLTATSSNLYVIPLPPIIGMPTAKINSIQWNLTDKSSAYETGLKLYDNNGNVASSSSPGATYIEETGLTANTQYSNRYVTAFNVIGESASSSVASSVYTLAPTPTNLSVSSNSNSITLTVDSFPNDTSGSSGYYFSRPGANSGWIQTNSWNDTGSSCGTSYTYSVIYRNGDGVETDPISVTKSTNSCPHSSSGSSVSPAMLATILTPSTTTTAYLKSLSEKKKVPGCPVNMTCTPIPGYIASSAADHRYTRDLTVGSKGDDVKALQVFLNSHGFIVSSTGPGSVGNETTFYGPATKAAMIRFQEAYSDAILKPLGLMKGTGYFGMVTRKYIHDNF